jgi:hypothetical protein
MTLITSKTPETWEELEELVAAILSECGMDARRQAPISLARGDVIVDVLALDIVDGITHRILCECKNWRTNIPKEVVHAFRTVMHESGAHRGYIISKMGFQAGGFEAARLTNIDLVTFAEFQTAHFAKWIQKRIWVIEQDVGSFNTYYEPLGPPGYAKLKNTTERAAYDEVWKRYAFAGHILHAFSPYMRMVGDCPYPPLPIDLSKLVAKGFNVPGDVRAAAGYRELLELLVRYARQGLAELRAVNPNTRDIPPEDIERDDC